MLHCAQPSRSLETIQRHDHVLRAIAYVWDSSTQRAKPAAHLLRARALHVVVDPLNVILERLLSDAVKHVKQAGQEGRVCCAQLGPAALDGLAQRGDRCCALFRILQQLLYRLDRTCKTNINSEERRTRLRG
jgi:hypothetical protein